MAHDERLAVALAPILDPVPWQSRWDDDPRAPQKRTDSLKWTRDLIDRINNSGIAWLAPWTLGVRLPVAGDVTVQMNHRAQIAMEAYYRSGGERHMEAFAKAWDAARYVYLAEQGESGDEA